MKWKVYSFTKRGFVIALLLLSEKVQYDRDYHYHCDYQYYACLLITMIVNCYYDCNWRDCLSSSYISGYHLVISLVAWGYNPYKCSCIPMYICNIYASKKTNIPDSKKHMVFPCINSRSWIIIFIRSNKIHPTPTPRNHPERKILPKWMIQKMHQPRGHLPPFPTWAESCLRGRSRSSDKIRMVLSTPEASWRGLEGVSS